MKLGTWTKIQIRRHRRKGKTLKEIAAMFDLSIKTIKEICNCIRKEDITWMKKPKNT